MHQKVESSESLKPVQQTGNKPAKHPLVSCDELSVVGVGAATELPPTAQG